MIKTKIERTKNKVTKTLFNPSLFLTNILDVNVGIEYRGWGVSLVLKSASLFSVSKQK
jgi:hypothetical protein